MAATANAIVRDRVKSVMDSLRGLAKEQVLVGIPEDKTAREGQITNAALGYIHEFGAPGANIPARPHLIPGVRKSAGQYMPHLKAAANFALDGEPQKVRHALMRAGIIASNAVRHEITTGDFVPLKPATVAARYRQRGTATRRAGENQYMELIRQGESPASAQSAAGIRPLMNTGALRNAYTFVVRRVK